MGKETAVDWTGLKPRIFGAIMDHYASGEPTLTGAGAPRRPPARTPAFRLLQHAAEHGSTPHSHRQNPAPAGARAEPAEV